MVEVSHFSIKISLSKLSHNFCWDKVFLANKNTIACFMSYTFMMYLEILRNAYILWAYHSYHKYSNLSTIWNITSRKLRFMQIGLHKYTNISVKPRDIGRPCTNILFDEYLRQATSCVQGILINKNNQGFRHYNSSKITNTTTILRNNDHQNTNNWSMSFQKYYAFITTYMLYIVAGYTLNLTVSRKNPKEYVSILIILWILTFCWP